MRKFVFASAVIGMLGFTGAASAEETRICQSVTKEQIAALFDRWNASLQTKNPDEVVKNYAADAVLLPTVSNKPRTNISSNFWK
jgi:hypothetical protein